ncbi:MAG: hypothetical protein F6K36_11215 [Symploca sp. SIO3C6]|nr:hypothetical protein [Symploca sp. SIO3C6]NET08302.1 hypothetical protein [Symploca sp. SIO2B6]
MRYPLGVIAFGAALWAIALRYPLGVIALALCSRHAEGCISAEASARTSAPFSP